MPVTENDLELLESYLDDALEIDEVEALRSRLVGDAELMNAMEDIRRERAARRAFFATLEPDDAAVDALLSRVRSSIRHPARTHSMAAPLRYLAAAAACIAVGFFSRGLFDRSSSSNTSQTNNKSGIEVQKVSAYQVTLRDSTGKVVATQRFDSFEKARDFAADVERWQAQTQRLATGRFVLTTDRF